MRSAPAVLSLSLLFACSGKVASVENGGTTDAGATPPSQQPDAGSRTTKACEALGGICLAAGESGPPNRKPTLASSPLCNGTDVCWVTLMPSGVCQTDADCNEAPAVSALWGQCFQGVCLCQPPFHVQPSGKCNKTPPPECNQQGGKCRQNPASCQPGELEGDLQTDMTCGDLVPAVCCFPAASCKAPIDLVCCGAAASYYEPTCVNGWKTCAAGAPIPRLRQDGCK